MAKKRYIAESTAKDRLKRGDSVFVKITHPSLPPSSSPWQVEKIGKTLIHFSNGAICRRSDLGKLEFYYLFA